MSIQKPSSLFVSIVQGIHVLSMIASLLGAIPFSIVSFFNTVRLLVWKIEAEPPDYFLTSFVFPFFLLPAALVLYLLAKGLGRFVAKELLSFLADTNRTIFEFCFVLAMLAWFLISINNGGLSK